MLIHIPSLLIAWFLTHKLAYKWERGIWAFCAAIIGSTISILVIIATTIILSATYDLTTRETFESILITSSWVIILACIAAIFGWRKQRAMGKERVLQVFE